MADGNDQSRGQETAILVDHGVRETWHHSVAFDGREYTTACGQVVWLAPIRAVVHDLTANTPTDSSADGWCSECRRSVQSVQSERFSGTDLEPPSLNTEWL